MSEHPIFRMLEQIGQGPRTLVHKAWDNSPLKRFVAIKILKPECRTVEPVRRRFWNNARFMAEQHHERLVPIYGVDEERDWVIMELADGSLADRVMKGKVPADEAQCILAQALEGLGALHSAGKLHGQIRPSNLLAYSSGRIKLSDPGGVTESGLVEYVPGNEKYLAPELANPEHWGAEIGPRLDLYCLAFATLEMLAGPEFDAMFPGMTAGGADRAAMWTKWHASEADPRELIRRLVPASAAALSEALQRMLTKAVAQRVANVDEVRAILGASAIPAHLQQGSSESSPAPVAPARAPEERPVAPPRADVPPPRRESPLVARPGLAKGFLHDQRKVRWAAAGILAVGLVAAIALAVIRSPSRTTQVAITSNPRGAEIWVDGEKAGDFTTPSKFPARRGRRYNVQVRLAGYQPSEVQPLDLTAAQQGDYKPITLSFTLVPGNTPKPTPPPENVAKPAPPPENVAKPTPPPAPVTVSGQSSSLPERPAWLHGAGTLVKHRQAVRAVAFSPDGQMAASAAEDQTVVVVDVATGAARSQILGDKDAIPTAVALVSTPVPAVVTGWDDGTLRYDPIQQSDAAGARGAQPLSPPSEGGPVLSLAVVSDGSRVAAGRQDKTVEVRQLPPGGNAGAQVWRNTMDGQVWDTALRPDGAVLAAATSGGQVSLFAADTGKPVSSQTFGSQVIFRSVYSPDGRWLALGMADGSVVLWQPDQSVKASLPARKAAVSGLVFIDLETLMATWRDGRICVWRCPALRESSGGISTKLDASSFQQIVALELSASIAVSAFDPREHRLICGFPDGSVRLYAASPLPADHEPVQPPQSPASSLSGTRVGG